MNYEFSFDHEKKDFVEALGISQDKKEFFHHRVNDILEEIDKEDKYLNKTEVIERILVSIPGNVSPIELFYLGFMVSETRGFKRGDEDAKNRLKDLAEVVKKLERDGLNPEEAIEKVLNDILDLDKLKDHVLSGENDF